MFYASMKISPIQSYTFNQKQKVQSRPNFTSQIALADVFCRSKSSTDGFLNDLSQAYPGLSTQKAIKKSCDMSQALGEGVQSVVYALDGVDDYVLKFYTNGCTYSDSWHKKPISPVKDEFEGENFGQAIGKIGHDVKILKRVQGKSHSLKNWFSRVVTESKPSLEEANEFLTDVKKIANFPQESYNEFARKLNYLTSRQIKFDSINPNNTMINYDNKEFGMVDVEPKVFKKFKNTIYDIIAPLLDYYHFEDYYNLLGYEEQCELIKCGRQIMDKALKTGIEADYLNHVNLLSKGVENGGEKFERMMAFFETPRRQSLKNRKFSQI